MTQTRQTLPWLSAETFRAEAIAPLRRVIIVHAGRIARQTETLETARNAVWRIARQFGAERLEPAWRDHLTAWIRETLERDTEAERARLVAEVRL